MKIRPSLLPRTFWFVISFTNFPQLSLSTRWLACPFVHVVLIVFLIARPTNRVQWASTSLPFYATDRALFPLWSQMQVLSPNSHPSCESFGHHCQWMAACNMDGVLLESHLAAGWTFFLCTCVLSEEIDVLISRSLRICELLPKDKTLSHCKGTTFDQRIPVTRHEDN